MIDPKHELPVNLTSIPMTRGYHYLEAVIDLASRRLLAWRGL